MRVTFTYSFIACLLFVGSLSAQQAILQPTDDLRFQKASMTKQMYTGFESLDVNLPNKPATTPEKEFEFQIGNTTYDLQTNSTNCNRISMTPDGRIAGVWTQGFDAAAGYPGRGTGYNSRIDFAWSEQPTGRLEDDATRTGWPNHVFTASGGEFVVAHSSTDDLVTLRRSGPMDAWTQSTIPSLVPVGNLWPRAAVGGADGETVHVIAVSTPTALGGGPFEGVNGHILYHRSTDGGATWDIVDLQIDGLGSDFTTGSDVDSYYIDAEGETVAFAAFNQWDDLLLFKSEDNGDTWTKTIVYDFPLDNYTINDGYTTADLPPYDIEAARMDSLDIFTNDGYGALIIDADGLVHLFFGNMWVNDADISDAEGTFSFYPGTNGLSYWNEFFALDDTPATTIAGTLDFDGDGVLDLAGDIAFYGASLSSMPTAGLDADGNIYLAFTAVREDLLDDGNDNQHYRHLFAVTSTDGGETWTAPVALLNETTVEEADFIGFTEAVYPTMVKQVDNNIRLIYQRDFRPGTAIGQDGDDPDQNDIMYLQFDVAELGVVRTEELVAPETFALKLAPSVTNATTQATFELPENSDVSLQLVNTHGQWVKNVAAERTLPVGQHVQTVDVSDLARGVYYLVMTVDQRYSVVELIKQ